MSNLVTPSACRHRAGLFGVLFALAALFTVAACDRDRTPIVADTSASNPAPTSLNGGDQAAGGGNGTAAGRRGSDYRLGANDRMRIVVFGEPRLTGEYTLDSNGTIAFPLIGQVRAAGTTTNQLQAAIASKLEPQYLVNPSVSVEVLTRRPFFVIGEVQKPGHYPHMSDITALHAVAIAGGFTYRARTSSFYVKRLDENGRMVRVPATSETFVQPGDTVEVSERYF